MNGRASARFSLERLHAARAAQVLRRHAARRAAMVTKSSDEPLRFPAIATPRCKMLTLIGDLPGMNQVCVRNGQAALDRSPDAADFDAPQVGRLPERRLGDARLQRDDGVDDLKEQRRRGLDTNEFRVALAVEVADPHCQHIRPEHAYGPRVAKPPRRAGFPRYRNAAPGRVGEVRARVVPQDVENDEARFFRKQADFLCRRILSDSRRLVAADPFHQPSRRPPPQPQAAWRYSGWAAPRRDWPAAHTSSPALPS